MKDQYTKAAAVAVPLVRGVGDDQLDGPTPCAEFTVRGLVNHLFQVMVEFEKAARFEEMDWTGSPEYLTGDWRERFGPAVDKAADAWSAPGALDDGATPTGFPRALLAQLPVFDLVVHGWDLAHATGQTHTADPALVDEIHAMAQQLAEGGRKMGQFGEPVAVPENAPTIDRLVGLLGRDPAWKP